MGVNPVPPLLLHHHPASSRASPMVEWVVCIEQRILLLEKTWSTAVQWSFYKGFFVRSWPDFLFLSPSFVSMFWVL
jgi:hypothetical protein